MPIFRSLLIIFISLTGVMSYAQVIDSLSTDQNTLNISIDDFQFLPENFDELQLEEDIPDDSLSTVEVIEKRQKKQ